MNLFDKTEKMRDILRDLIFHERCIKNALSIAWVYGDFNRLNFDRLRNDEEIVSYLSEKVERQLKNILKYDDPAFVEEKSLVHIMTQGYDHGGHSELLLNLVKGMSLEGYKQKVILTGSMPSKLKNKIQQHNVEVYNCLNSNIDSISEIVSQSLPFPNVALHIHPNDIFSAVAAKFLTSLKKRVMFIDHADHSFSFGRESCSAVLDVSAFGWKLNEVNDELSHSFLGIPVNTKIEKNNTDNDMSIKDDKGFISALSVGRPSKYRPTEGANFVEFLNRLLISNDNIKISMVGPSGSEAWWSRLDPAIVSRVNFYGLRSSEDLPYFYRKADIYIDSFPVTGATTAMEAFAYGCNVFGLRFHLGGYNPVEYLYDDNFDAIIRRINKIYFDEKIIGELEFLKKEIEMNFSNEATVHRLLDALSGKYHNPPEILNSEDETYKVYELPWLCEGQLRWPHRTFIKIPRLQKVNIIIKYIFLNGTVPSLSQMKNYIFWVLRSR